MRTGEKIYKRRDGRWEARYRRGRKEDGRIFYGSCYGKTYQEAKSRMEQGTQSTARSTVPSFGSCCLTDLSTAKVSSVGAKLLNEYGLAFSSVFPPCSTEGRELLCCISIIKFHWRHAGKSLLETRMIVEIDVVFYCMNQCIFICKSVEVGIP